MFLVHAVLFSLTRSGVAPVNQSEMNGSEERKVWLEARKYEHNNNSKDYEYTAKDHPKQYGKFENKVFVKADA